MSWSRIQYTELATEAYIRMSNDINRHYHNVNHVDSMYQYLEDADEPYDEALDWAVMFHDVVYDDQPDKERRSAELFEELSLQYPRGCSDRLSKWIVGYRIMQTATHIAPITEPGAISNSAIIRADLHALTDPVQTVRNFTAIMDESMGIYQCNLKTFAQSNYSFMRELRNRVESNIIYDPDHAEFYKQVIEGIRLTMGLASSIFGRS